VLDEKDQSTMPNKEEAVKAYIYAKNIELWESVFVSEKRYNEVAGKKICNDEEVELCRKIKKSKSCNLWNRWCSFFCGRGTSKSWCRKLYTS